MAGKNWLFAAIGFIISGTLIPLAALLALAVTRADGIFGLARPLGKKFALTFLILVHLTLGPLFATPRTATVPFSMFSDYFSKGMQPWALLIYSAVFFGIVYYCSLSEGKITDRVGKILNPSFLALLFIIFLIAAIKPMGATSSTQASADYLAAPLTNGFLQGYNTLDALAALTFGITVVTAIKGLQDQGRQGNYLGTFGEALLATLATITCMSTAICLVVAFAQDFHKRFPKISYRTFLTFNCLLSFAIANFGLTTIIAWSTPVLMFLYPLAIALIFCGLTSKFFNNDPAVYKFAVYFTIIPALFDGLTAAPSIISNTVFAKAALTFASRYLPQKIQRESKLSFHAVSFYSYSKKFGWKGLPQMSLRQFFLTW